MMWKITVKPERPQK